jgi:hypothetical protein
MDAIDDFAQFLQEASDIEQEEDYKETENYLVDLIESISDTGRVCRLYKMALCKPQWRGIRVMEYSVTIYKINSCEVDCIFDGDTHSESRLGALIRALEEFCERNGIKISE